MYNLNGTAPVLAGTKALVLVHYLQGPVQTSAP